MHIEYIPTRTSTGKLSHTCILLRHNYRENGKIKKKTIMNLTHVKPEILAAYKTILANKHRLDSLLITTPSEMTITAGKSIGAIWMIVAVAGKLHIPEAIGLTTKDGKLALWQIIARVVAQGSRLSSIRLHQTHELADVIGIDTAFTEDTLYRNLHWLAKNQDAIEKRLFAKTHAITNETDLFLYDVTSSYLEGTCNELAAYGYNRDKKRGKKQIVMGLLCDSTGDAVSTHLFAGNTADTDTFHDQVEKVKKEFGVKRVTWVGDRGVIKGDQMREVTDDKDFYITGLTKSQIRHMIKEETIQLGLFDERLKEIVHEGVRYIFRRNPQRVDDLKQIRKEKYDAIEQLVQKQQDYLHVHQKASVSVAVKTIEKKITQLKCEKWMTIVSDTKERTLTLKRDEAVLRQESCLDGCYMMRTNLPVEISKETINNRYKDLILVERAFEESKTGLLELRPWYVITEESSRGHALVVMLAYKIIHYLETVWKPFNLTVEEGIAKLATITTTHVAVKGVHAFDRIPRPDTLAQQLLTAAGVILPDGIPHVGAHVVSRKKLQKERK